MTWLWAGLFTAAQELFFFPCNCYCITSSKRTWVFEEPLLGGVCTHCEDSLYLDPWQRLCLAACSNACAEPAHLSGFQLVYSNVLWDKAWDKLSLVLKGFFLFPCFEKAFKKSNKYLDMYLMSALRMTVNLSLRGVRKEVRLTGVSVVAKIMQCNSEAFLTLQVWVYGFRWEGVWGFPIPYDRFPCQAYKLIFDCQPRSSYCVLWQLSPALFLCHHQHTITSAMFLPARQSYDYAWSNTCANSLIAREISLVSL